MNRSTLLIIIVALIAGGFLINRQSELSHLRGEVNRIQNEKLNLQQARAEKEELQKIYADGIDVAAFAEELYGCARRSGIRDHIVTTRPYRPEQQLRAGRSRKANNDLVIHRLQVDLVSSFRRIAEYIDHVQKLDSRKRITSIEMIPGVKRLETTLIVDLYSLEVTNVR